MSDIGFLLIVFLLCFFILVVHAFGIGRGF